MTSWIDRCRQALQSAAQQHQHTVDIESALAAFSPLSLDTWIDAFTSIRFPESMQRGRRSAGAYYTPSALIEPILEHSLGPILIQRICSQRDWESLLPIEQWTDQDRTIAAQTLLELRILDPSCGPGLFLLAAGQWLARQLLLIRFGHQPPPPSEYQRARQEIAQYCLFGIDIDPSATRAAQLLLDHWVHPDDPKEDLHHLVVADGLQPDDRSFASQTFDIVIGNPPFANAIEKEVDGAIQAAKRSRTGSFADLGGTADLAYYFLARAHEITRPDGAVGFVLPRAFLSTRSSLPLRQRLRRERPPALIFAPSDPFLFPGANIFVCAIVLRQTKTCLAGVDRLESITIHSDNWWSDLAGSAVSIDTSTRRVADYFEVFGSMTTGMAYDLLPFVREATLDEVNQPKTNGPMRLVTTGLIEPNQCDWGTKRCRYLKQTFNRPVIDISESNAPPYLGTRLKRVARPKVIVAGLSLRLETFLDEAGIYAGAVSTYTIVDRDDNIEQLRRLADYLNSDDATQRMKAELGATALGGGRITLTKAFLAGLPWQEK
jgi:hypothetical protein